MITKLSYKSILLAIMLMSSLIGITQNEPTGEIQPLSKLLIKTNFRVPFSTSNTFFKEVGSGVVDLSGSFNYSFIKNVYLGAGYNYSFFKLSEKKLNASPNQQFGAKIELQGFFAGVSYFYNLYDNVAIEANFQVGRQQINTGSIACEKLGVEHNKKGMFYNPNVNVYLLGEEVFSFYFSLGYRFSSQGFEPGDVCNESFPGYDESHYQGNYQQFNVGFGIGISLVKPSN